MVAVDFRERVGIHPTDIQAIRKDRINMVAIIRGDSNDNRAAIIDGGFRRGDRASLSCRRRHRVFIDGKLRHDRMTVADIRKDIAVGNFHRFIIHQQATDMPTRGGDN